MTLDNVRTPSNPRKKAIAGIVLLIMFLLIWQISSMFGKTGNSPPKAAAGVAVAQETGAAPAAVPPPPKQAAVPQAVPMTEREIQLMTLQQETQVKYLQALNELQMLKVTRDIAQTNKDISSANLDRVTAEKKIVDMLSAPVVVTSPAETLSQGMPGGAPTSVTTTSETTTVAPVTEVSWSVVSISQVQYRWGAVLSYRGTLYSVHVGDVLPADGSTVAAIGKDSVTLVKNGVRKKISLVSII